MITPYRDPDPWMVIYRRNKATDGSFDLQDVAVPLARFNASEVPADEWQSLRPMRTSDLNQRYPLMARE